MCGCWRLFSQNVEKKEWSQAFRGDERNPNWPINSDINRFWKSRKNGWRMDDSPMRSFRNESSKLLFFRLHGLTSFMFWVPTTIYFPCLSQKKGFKKCSPSRGEKSITETGKRRVIKIQTKTAIRTCWPLDHKVYTATKIWTSHQAWRFKPRIKSYFYG